ncbi:MAG: chemotaxis protein CheR [Alphaproteobacteria bacterium]|uniref:Chemotaxis protein CheR n=1 Tax=Candidatus Nitrobium versatile TaxID=2884831 RepID=A0A953JGE0_9BACT|nr:chemotaxis protein CheR [Candidatus Nitrobium versatile]
MKDLECTEFLQWGLPRLRFRWSGFRKVRKQVCKRLQRRISELGLSDISTYKGYLDSHSAEWEVLDSLCQITISRFYRDRRVFDALCSTILPGLAKNASETGAHEIRCWCAGCCSGEEAYTLQILWRTYVMPALQRQIPLRIIATDLNPDVLERAQKGAFPASSLVDLPEKLIREAFECSGSACTIRGAFREDVEFARQDIREQLPEGTFHLLLCRNLVFTYFDRTLQLEILERIVERLSPGGFFVIGIHESLPDGVSTLVPYNKLPGVYQKSAL